MTRSSDAKTKGPELGNKKREAPKRRRG